MKRAAPPRKAQRRSTPKTARRVPEIQPTGKVAVVLEDPPVVSDEMPNDVRELLKSLAMKCDLRTEKLNEEEHRKQPDVSQKFTTW